MKSQDLEILWAIVFGKTTACQTVVTALITPRSQPLTFGSHYSRFHPNCFSLAEILPNAQRTYLSR